MTFYQFLWRIRCWLRGRHEMLHGSVIHTTEVVKGKGFRVKIATPRYCEDCNYAHGTHEVLERKEIE